MTKRKNNKNILISNSERNLVLNSSICGQGKNLKQILSSFTSSIKQQDLPLIQSQSNRIYNIIKEAESRNELIEMSSKEWESYKPIGRLEDSCELCGSTLSEYKYIIKNKITGAELKVGSSCINKFPQMGKKCYGESLTNITRWQKDNPQKINRLASFNTRYNGGKIIIDNWKWQYEDFPIEFPSSFDAEFQRIYNQAKNFYNKYINSEIPENKLDNFERHITDANYFLQKCRNFYEENKQNKFICTKNIAQILIKKGYEYTLQEIKSRNCIIPEFLSKYIAAPHFVNSFKDIISEEFEHYGLLLQDINDQFVNFEYKYQKFNTLNLNISISNFVNLHSRLFYGKKVRSINEAFESICLQDEIRNIGVFLEILEIELKKATNKSIYYFKYDIRFYSKRMVELHNRKEKKYTTINIQDIIQEYVQILYLDNIKKETFLNNMLEKAKWITYSEKDKFDIGDITSVFATEKID